MAKVTLPGVVNTYENAHEVIKGDPRTDGPYLDDIRAAQEDAYREARMAAMDKAAAKTEVVSSDKKVKKTAKKSK